MLPALAGTGWRNYSPPYSGQRWVSSALARARFLTRAKLLFANVPAGPREPLGW
jgi:hypothetical protein